MAAGAYQTSGFAYQGSGAFAYQSGIGVTPPSGGRASGGGEVRRADFGFSGKRLTDDEPPKPIEKAARKAADAVIEQAQKLAREKAALNALKVAEQREKTSKARLAKTAAMEARVAEMEANLAILQDDEEVLQLFIRILTS